MHVEMVRVPPPRPSVGKVVVEFTPLEWSDAVNTCAKLIKDDATVPAVIGLIANDRTKLDIGDQARLYQELAGLKAEVRRVQAAIDAMQY